jgi:hypothetical protein
MARSVVHIPWYATGFRKEDLAAALGQISAISLRYGATRYSVYQGLDDQYKMLQVVEFENKEDWNRYWYGEEFQDMRASCSSWYQVPVLYAWQDVVGEGSLDPAAGPVR